MNMEQSLGLGKSCPDTAAERRRLQLYINLKLSSTGQPTSHTGGDEEFLSIAHDLLASYRVKQGILHNPANDRRTTKGSFHIAEGGLPIPGDKKAVPKIAYVRFPVIAPHRVPRNSRYRSRKKHGNPLFRTG